jgi:glycosyltransferase involved in cell wall biosynthesis
MSKKLRILLSAYACEPDKGSEPGVGWHWALEIARLGHEVWVLTRENNIPVLERALIPYSDLRIHLVGYDLPQWMRRWKKSGRGIVLYYSMWQRGAYRVARRLERANHFDLVHHITFGVYRQASLLGRLGVPLVLGPLGGGEKTPPLLLSSYPLRGILMELVRSFSNLLAGFSPTLRQAFKQASVILCKTKETLAEVPRAYRAKCLIMKEIGIEETLIMGAPTTSPHTPRFLYVGRLLYWKGVHLALQALARVLKDSPDARLTIVGAGQDETWLREMADRLGIADAVEWMGGVPHEKVLNMYSEYTAFLFPSLHDSSGNVFMEALSQGLPVICLDCGGPGAMLPSACGFKIEVEGRSQQELVTGLSDAMQTIFTNSEVRAEMSAQALKASRENTWRHVVSSAYRNIQDTLLSK